MGSKKCGPFTVAWVLVIIGALNWGLVGLGSFFGGNWNIVEWIIGSWPTVENVVYVLVGLAGAYAILGCRCKNCKAHA